MDGTISRRPKSASRAAHVVHFTSAFYKWGAVHGMRLLARFFRQCAHTKSECTGCEVELTSITEGHSTTDSDTAPEGMAATRSGRVVGHLAVWKASFVIMGVLLLVTGCQPNDDLIVTAITADGLAGSFVGLREEVSILITPSAPGRVTLFASLFCWS